MSESLFPTRWAKDKPPSLEKFTSDFADDYACAEYLAKKRWKDGFRCTRCGGNRAWRLEACPWVWEWQGIAVADDGVPATTGYRHQTSLIAGTVMHGTQRSVGGDHRANAGAECVEGSVAVDALNDRLNLGAMLIVVGQRRQRDLRFTRITVAQDQQAISRHALGQHFAP